MSSPVNTSIVEHCQTLEDPRVEWTKKHNLLDILVIALWGSIQNTCQNRSQATVALNSTRKNNKFEMLNFRREDPVSGAHRLVF